MPNTMTRKQLYDLVWSEPLRAIAPRFGVSDVWLAKLCCKHNIPQPPRGYWAKLAAGKKVSRFPLPPREIGMSDELTIGRETYYYRTRADDDELIASEIGPPPTFEEPIDEIRARIVRRVGKVGIPRDLTRAHHGIAELLRADEERRAKYVASRYPSMFDAPLFDSPFEKRRLRVMNALMLVLARMGAKPSLKGKDPDGFSITVGEQHFGITVDEPNCQRSGWRNDRDRVKPAATPLRVHMGSYISCTSHTWQDKGRDRVEDHLADIVTCAIVAGEEAYRNGRIAAHEWRIKRKAELIEERRKEQEERERKRREREAAEEKARIDGLLADADNHRRANDIRGYVAEVRRQASTDAASNPELMDRWSEWARAQAERLDPLTNGKLLVSLGRTTQAERDN